MSSWLPLYTYCYITLVRRHMVAHALMTGWLPGSYFLCDHEKHLSEEQFFLRKEVFEWIKPPYHTKLMSTPWYERSHHLINKVRSKGALWDPPSGRWEITFLNWVPTRDLPVTKGCSKLMFTWNLVNIHGSQNESHRHEYESELYGEEVW